MSCSYNAGVILGVKLDEIEFDAKLISESYEAFDKKGNLTGNFEKEYSWSIIFKGETMVEEGEKLYADVIEDIINVNKPLNFIDLNIEDFDLNKIIIGIVLTKKGYDDWNIVP